MTSLEIDILRGRTPGPLQRALRDFEASFDYPLGPDTRFRIAHGDEYCDFFSAMGEAEVFVARLGDEVLGVLGTAVRRMRSSSGETLPALVLCDLKVRPGGRRGWVLARLIASVRRRFEDQLGCGYAVVMDGTAATPEDYTGRLGVPQFQAVARLGVLRAPRQPSEVLLEDVSEEDLDDLFWELGGARVAALTSRPELRSRMAPRAWRLPDGQACARLEDTRRAKLLTTSEGELISGHLSRVAGAPEAVARLVRGLLARLETVPALFWTVPFDELAFWRESSGVAGLSIATATVYATGLPAGPWSIDTAEI